jgi:hypothetical protein
MGGGLKRVAESYMSQDVYAYGVTREEVQKSKGGMQGAQLYLQINHSLRKGYERAFDSVANEGAGKLHFRFPLRPRRRWTPV